MMRLIQYWDKCEVYLVKGHKTKSVVYVSPEGRLEFPDRGEVTKKMVSFFSGSRIFVHFSNRHVLEGMNAVGGLNPVFPLLIKWQTYLQYNCRGYGEEIRKEVWRLREKHGFYVKELAAQVTSRGKTYYTIR